MCFVFKYHYCYVKFNCWFESTTVGNCIFVHPNYYPMTKNEFSTYFYGAGLIISPLL